MKLQIESTKKLTTIDGVPVRVWQGKTEQGIECFVFVHRISVKNEQGNTEQFDRELKEMSAPQNSQYFDMRQIL